MRLKVSFRTVLSSTKRLGVLILLLVVLGGAIKGVGSFYRKHLEEKWQTISQEKEQELSDEITLRFSRYQKETLAAAQEVASQQKIQGILTAQPLPSRAALFGLLLSLQQGDLSYEMYDSQKQLYAWAGNKGISVDTSFITENVSSFVSQGAISTYLVVNVPIKTATSQRWYLIGKRLFDVNYPISNRFISNDAFSSTFTSNIPVSVTLDFSSTARSNSDSSSIAIPLNSIDGRDIGYAYAQRPQLQISQDEVQESFTKVYSALLFVIMILLGYGAVSVSKQFPSRFFKVVLFTAVLWLFRYGMIWLNIPQVLVNISIFDPKIFASSFGSGIVLSIGDMCISAFFLLWNMVVIASNVSGYLSNLANRSSEPLFIQKILMAIGVLVIPFMMCLCLRGVASTIHSAVFDSSLTYNDPTFIFPPFDLAIMLISLFCVTCAFVLSAFVMLRYAYVSFSRIVSNQVPGLTMWMIIAGLCLITGILFGALQAHPLTSQFARILILGCFIIVCMITGSYSNKQTRAFVGSAIVVVAVSALLVLVPLIDDNVHELDRARVELLSTEVLRPSDNWLTVVVNQALDQLANDEAVTILSSHEEGNVEKLAFMQWAKSILSNEGNNCSVMFMDRHGHVVSDFHIGMTPHRTSEHFIEISPTKRYVDAENAPGANAVRWYRGYSPIVAANGELVGGVWVELSAGKQTTLRGETPEVLKNYTKEHFESHYRTLDISEYLDGKLLSSTNENFPHDRELPGTLIKNDSTKSEVWLEESVEGTSYETYYRRQPADLPHQSWIALSLQSLDVRWHLYSYLRYVLFYALLFSIGCIFMLLYVWMREGRIALTFRAKLMAAFIIVSFIPIVILAYYNRQYAMERTEQMIIQRLSDQTAIVGAELQRQFGVDARYGISKLTDEQCVALADQLDTDFNVYNENSLQSSSKPEMVMAELLDTRVSAPAYMNVVMKRKNFFSENQAIGKLPYVVGYRPITSDDGGIIGLISIPTLFRQNDVDEELTRRNVFLFGAYALALLLSLVAGTLFVNQIASPIVRLKNATKQIAEGNLTVHLHSGRKDVIGELETAFDEMARDLRESQKQMAKAQRDIAWKEMAKQVAHEIKNPLTPIKLSVQHLRQTYADGVRDFGLVLHQVTNTILEQIDTLSRIASEFSQYGRMPERKIDRYSVHALVRETVELFKQHAEMTIITSLTAPFDEVKADRDELRRAFINIVRNAIQATNERGTIHIMTALTGEHIEIHFQDNGHGISEDVQEHLFEPNFSTKTDGMGLGLSIVKKTIDDMQGTIDIDSAIGSGTTVTMILPLAK